MQFKLIEKLKQIASFNVARKGKIVDSTIASTPVDVGGKTETLKVDFMRENKLITFSTHFALST